LIVMVSRGATSIRKLSNPLWGAGWTRAFAWARRVPDPVHRSKRSRNEVLTMVL
jgi:hypothetical protein